MSIKTFIPISLGNHYYSRDVLSFILEAYIKTSETSHLLICDRLREISYRIRGFNDLMQVKVKVEKEVEQFVRTLNNIGINDNNTNLCTWKIVKHRTEYTDILFWLESLVNNDNELFSYVVDLAQSKVKRFQTTQDTSPFTSELQLRYIYEETAISVFFTEILGAYVEIYKREEDGLIKVLHESYGSQLCEFLKESELKREFISLENVMCN